MESGILSFGSSRTIRIQNPNFTDKDWKLVHTVPRIRNPWRGVHNPRLSWSERLTFDRYVMGSILACSKRSDSGERWEVKKAIKSRGGLGREVRVPSLSSSPPSLLFFRAPFLLRTARHYLNAWNRLVRFLRSDQLKYHVDHVARNLLGF